MHLPFLRALFIGAAALCAASCAAIAGVSDYSVDPCFGEACIDGAEPETGPEPVDASDAADARDALDAADASEVDSYVPPPSPGLSDVVVSGTGVAVGKSAVVTLTTRDASGAQVPRTGAAVSFSTANGTSVLGFGPVEDRGDGTYRVLAIGMTEGSPVDILATLDGAALTTTPPKLRVVNPPSTGLTFSIDAANADRAGDFGGKGCAASGLSQWTDLTSSSFAGSLNGFDDPCAPGSGWAGAGVPENPYRLSFDGVDDNVAFGTVNSLSTYTIIAWIRRTGDGWYGETSPDGGGGLTGATAVWPLVTRGTAELEQEAVDIDYYLGIIKTGQLGADYETKPGSVNQGLIGATTLNQNQWYMVATTLDASASTRALWVDGAMDAMTTPQLPPAGAASSVLTIGGAKRSTDAPGATTCPGMPGGNGCARFKGEIAIVLTYDHALTQTEMEATCHSYSSRFGMMDCPN